MLIKVGADLFRILELQHLTPGNMRALVQVAHAQHPDADARRPASSASEDDVERATLDEREMQYLYNDGDGYYFMDTSTLRADSHSRTRCSATR